MTGLTGGVVKAVRRVGGPWMLDNRYGLLKAHWLHLVSTGYIGRFEKERDKVLLLRIGLLDA